MARVTTEQKMLQMATHNIRLRALGHAAIGIWVQLISYIIEYGTDGVLVPGRDGAPTLAEIAEVGLRMDVTELVTHLETYVETQLITHDRAIGTIGLPGALMPSRKALAARENGKKGGRPPTKTNPKPQDDPRQRTAIMGIAGGKDMTAETRRETHDPKLGLEVNNNLKAKPAAQDVDAVFRVLGRKAWDAAGFDPVRDKGNWGQVRQWVADALAEGLSAAETERLVMDVVAKVTDRQRQKGQTIKHMGYFNAAIGQAIKARDIPALVCTTEAEFAAEAAYTEAHRQWVLAAASGSDAPQPRREDFIASARAAA
ncbi:hypothetical protein ACM0P6_02905 [Komagataeibacter sucrofermentans]|uniref:Uncharacterized protein n=1 Tax=Komagataeibacter sucrofermentans TaxID=1053551 RepID=A0A318QPV4_9PROT|nr:hypothetical protein [Komagataeibacter sucrofermentans]PYD79974.1 hypothetical protein CFR77_05545 [Komagataeibacter sucrofermentans]GBQ52220.1 hypothetical protein AA15973_2700 [Komagataeibacter sucrofermentans DSM 15973]